jgi:hypothetical protein
VSLERNVRLGMDAWCVVEVEEEGPLSPRLAVVGTFGIPVSLEGLGVCHFWAWSCRIDELVMDLNYRMGPCGKVSRELRSCNGDLQN